MDDLYLSPANRFGLEQVQPLIASRVKNNFRDKPALEINGSDYVFVSILKTENDGKKSQIRLRSISDKDDLVKLAWLDRKPLSVTIEDFSAGAGKKEVKEEILVPAMGFITLNVRW